MKVIVIEELVLTPEEIKIINDAAELADKIYAEAATDSDLERLAYDTRNNLYDFNTYIT